jgi:head-tail adaptor
MRKQLITLEMRQQAADGSTGIAETFVPVGEMWVRLGGVAGTTNQSEQQIVEGVTHRMVMAWVDPTTFNHVAAKGGAQRFRVRFARDPDGRQMRLELHCEELFSEVPA